MPGSRATLPAPDLPAGARSALVVATTTYADPTLRQLRAPAQDAADFGALLADPAVGGFDVRTVVDGTAQEVRVAVEDFLADRSPDELLLLYLSCHGLVDVRRRLYFAATDTRKDRLAATGVESQWVLDQLEDCRARQQVVVLDCCFSGAFAQGVKGDPDLSLGERFHGEGRGRVVLTASRGSEYSFEGEPVPEASMPRSVFTSALVEGIRSGAADGDRDGFISVDDAYRFAFDRMRASLAHQTPQRWLYGAEGSILLARSPAGVTVTAAPLSDAVRAGLDSSHPAIRRGAVTALGEWLTDDEPSHAVAARLALERVAANDIPSVADAARRLLDDDGHDDAHAADAHPPDREPAAAQPAAAEPDRVGPPPTPAEPAPPTGPRRRRSGLPRAVWIAAGVVAVAVAAVFALTNLLSGPTRPNSGSGGSSSAGAIGVTGTITASGPWRLVVKNEVGAIGCNVRLTDASGPKDLNDNPLYDTTSYQVATGGTFAWWVNDPGCIVFKRNGGGDRTLPFLPETAGDTEVFDAPPAPKKVRIEVKNYQGSSGCDLALVDAADGRIVDANEAVKNRPPVLLDPGESTRLYLRATTCLFRVSAQ